MQGNIISGNLSLFNEFLASVEIFHDIATKDQQYFDYIIGKKISGDLLKEECKTSEKSTKIKKEKKKLKKNALQVLQAQQPIQDPKDRLKEYVDEFIYNISEEVEDLHKQCQKNLQPETIIKVLSYLQYTFSDFKAHLRMFIRLDKVWGQADWQQGLAKEFIKNLFYYFSWLEIFFNNIDLKSLPLKVLQTICQESMNITEIVLDMQKIGKIMEKKTNKKKKKKKRAKNANQINLKDEKKETDATLQQKNIQENINSLQFQQLMKTIQQLDLNTIPRQPCNIHQEWLDKYCNF